MATLNPQSVGFQVLGVRYPGGCADRLAMTLTELQSAANLLLKSWRGLECGSTMRRAFLPRARIDCRRAADRIPPRLRRLREAAAAVCSSTPSIDGLRR